MYHIYQQSAENQNVTIIAQLIVVLKVISYYMHKFCPKHIYCLFTYMRLHLPLLHNIDSALKKLN